jgi:hypothetical protein
VYYLAARFVDDPHVWALTLDDEVVRLCAQYPSFVRQLRASGLRPHGETCTGVKGSDSIEIESLTLLATEEASGSGDESGTCRKLWPRRG